MSEKSILRTPGRESVDVGECVQFCVQKGLTMVVTGAACALAAMLFCLFSPMRYEATAKLYILSAEGGGIQTSQLQAGSMLLADYREVFRTWEVHEAVCRQLGTELTYQQFQDLITVQTPEDTRLFYITARHESPAFACELANACAQAARSFIAENLRGLTLSVFSTAVIPARASGLSVAAWALIAFASGAAAAAAFWVVVFCLEDRIRSEKAVQTAAGLTTLADESDSGQLLTARLVNRRLGCVLIAREPSAFGFNPACRKLLDAMESLRRKTLLMRIDHSGEASGKWLQCLEKERDVNDLLYPIAEKNAFILTLSAPKDVMPSLLFHPGMAGLMEQLKQSFDVILIDAPAVTQGADASAFLPFCDGAVISLLRGQSRFRQLLAQLEMLAEAGCPALGVLWLAPCAPDGGVGA